MQKTKTATLLAVALTLGGCSETLKKFEPYVGPVAGGAIAGGLCNAYFKGKGKEWLATSLCAAGGALLGKLIQGKLQASEKPVLTEATYNTLQTGQKQTVVTEEGTTITTERVQPVVSPSPAPVASASNAPKTTRQPRAGQQSKPNQPAPTPAAAPSSAPVVAEGRCGTVKQTIVLKNKERYEDTITACQQDGVWVG